MKLPNYSSIVFALLLSVGGGIAEADTLPRQDLPVTPYLTGQLLVANRHMTDPNFVKAVIYMISYSEEGAMGVIVNRVLGTIGFRKLLATLGIKTRLKKKVNVYFGGPVDIGRGLILHSPDYTGASTQHPGQSIAVSTGPDILQALAEGKGPKQSRIILGYAGWEAGQLDHELARGDWLVAPADPALIFSTGLKEIWAKALKHAGISL